MKSRTVHSDIERLPILTEIAGMPYRKVESEARKYHYLRNNTRIDYGGEDTPDYRRPPNLAFTIGALRKELERDWTKHGSNYHYHPEHTPLRELTAQLFKPEKLFVATLSYIESVFESTRFDRKQAEKDLSRPLGERLETERADKFGEYVTFDGLIYALGRIPYNKDTPDEQISDNLSRSKDRYDCDMIIYTNRVSEGFVNPYELCFTLSNLVHDFRIISEITE